MSRETGQPRSGAGAATGGVAGARGPYPLGGHGDSGGLERLHGRSDTLRRESRPRSARLLRTTAPGTGGKTIRVVFYADTLASFTRVRGIGFLRTSPGMCSAALS